MKTVRYEVKAKSPGFGWVIVAEVRTLTEARAAKARRIKLDPTQDYGIVKVTREEVH